MPIYGRVLHRFVFVADRTPKTLELLNGNIFYLGIIGR